MAEMAFNVHLPRADLDLRFVCSTLEPLIDFKFEVESSFLFVSTKYRQNTAFFPFATEFYGNKKNDSETHFFFAFTKYTKRQEIFLETLRFMVCCVFMIPTGEFKKCHIQSSPRTVNDEEAQSSCWQVVKVALLCVPLTR